METISVVIPTYNRSAQLSEVLDHLLLSNTSRFAEVEILVIDDGSPVSAKPIIESKKALQPFKLKYLRQENAGPGKARNYGFMESSHEVVLFLDDDVLVTPYLLEQHVDAHRKKPNSIIFGPYPYQKPKKETPAFRYLQSLVDKGLSSLKAPEHSGFIKVNTVASGNLSVEKKMFMENGGVYNPGLTIPAAEEFDLIARLAADQTEIYMAPQITAIHTQPATIEDKCKQEYKYGLGIAEVWRKNPEVRDHEFVIHFLKINGYVSESDSSLDKIKKCIKVVFSSRIVRESLLKITNLLESIFPVDILLFPLYKFHCSISFFAGIRDGLKQFNLNPQNEVA